MVVETVDTAPLTVDADTPHLVTPAPQFGLAVPRVVVELVATGAGLLLLQIKRKYGDPLESTAVARHCCTEPEFVGVEVDDSITSYGFCVKAGGVFNTVSVVEAVLVAFTMRPNWCEPASNRKATTNTITPVRAVRMVIFPAVCISFGNSFLLYDIINTK